MKRFAVIMMIMLMTSGILLTGCKSQDADKDSTEITENTDITNENSEEETASKNSEKSSEASENVVEIPSARKIEKQIDEMQDWVGLQYMMDPTTDYDSLTNDVAIEIAAYAYAKTAEGLEYTENGLCIPKAYMDEKMQDMFGKTYNMERYTEKRRGNLKTAPGKVYINQGDWGMVQPVYAISNIDDHGDGEFHITLRYYAEDLETASEYGNYRYDMELICRVNDESTYGFVITDLKAVRTGADPAPFDFSTIEGVYKTEIPEILEGETVTHTGWLVIEKDGKGYMYDRDRTTIVVNRYDIIPYSQSEIAYTYYEDMITLYLSDDVTRVYTRTDEEPEL